MGNTGRVGHNRGLLCLLTLEMFTVRFPGQGSDGPGIVRVFDPAGRMLKQFALDWLGDAEPVYEGSHCATIQTLHTFCWPDRLQYHGSPG